MSRANLIGKGSQETPEPEDEQAEIVDPLGREDHSATNLVELDDEEGNKKPRRVSKTAPSAPAE